MKIRTLVLRSYQETTTHQNDPLDNQNREVISHIIYRNANVIFLLHVFCPEMFTVHLKGESGIQ